MKRSTKEIDLPTALSVMTGIPADELLGKKWSMKDLQEKTKAFHRVYSATVDDNKGGRVSSLLMDETEPT